MVEFDGYVEDKKSEKVASVCSDIINFFVSENKDKMKTKEIKEAMFEKYKHSKHYVGKALKDLCSDKMLVDKPYGSYTVLK